MAAARGAAAFRQTESTTSDLHYPETSGDHQQRVEASRRDEMLVLSRTLRFGFLVVMPHASFELLLSLTTTRVSPLDLPK
jgi:hypothetical protein